MLSDSTGQESVQAGIDRNDLISWDGGDLVVHSASQFGPYVIDYELVTGPTPLDLNGWETVVEFSFSATGPVIVAELVDGDPYGVLTQDPGTYRIRVCARQGATRTDDANTQGAAAEGVIVGRGKEAVPETYLITVWPAPWASFKLTRQSPQNKGVTNRREEIRARRDLIAVEGEHGAIQIGRDVDGGNDARHLGGQTGSIHVFRTMPGTRRRWFGSFSSRPVSRAGGWTHFGRFDLQKVGVVSSVATAEYDRDPLAGRTGLIDHEYLEVVSPSRSVSRWGWFGRLSGQATAEPGNARTIALDTRVSITYLQFKDESGEPHTVIDLKHAHLPVEWVEDMEAWWTWQLALAHDMRLGTT